MSDYYRLKDNFILRGWEEIPYVLIQRPENRTMYLNKTSFDALSLCAGNYDLGLGIIPRDVKNAVKQAEKEGIVEQCSRGTGLLEDQKYKRYENRFIHSVHWSITGKCNYRCGLFTCRKGKIAEEGTYEELIEKDGYFAELVKRQRVDVSSS